ncbi:MAG TPA: hypothetical protein VG389_27750 [Myxococcota bacterium]|jgi:hypothetical protein|nr:hypothetical protein [Myxococcota bacterium]
MDLLVRLWGSFVAVTLPVLALASMPGETDVGFGYGAGRHYNICGAPSTFTTYTVFAETRLSPGVRMGVAGRVYVDGTNDAAPRASYMATGFAGYDFRWFGFTLGAGYIGTVGARGGAFLPQASLRGGGETGFRGETAVGLATAHYPASGLLRTGVAYAWRGLDVGVGLDLEPYLEPGLYAYAGARLDQLVLRVEGRFGPLWPPGDPVDDGFEYGGFATVGLHFDHPAPPSHAPSPASAPSSAPLAPPEAAPPAEPASEPALP